MAVGQRDDLLNLEFDPAAHASSFDHGCLHTVLTIFGSYGGYMLQAEDIDGILLFLPRLKSKRTKS